MYYVNGLETKKVTSNKQLNETFGQFGKFENAMKIW
jgi:hypothetical protein